MNLLAFERGVVAWRFTPEHRLEWVRLYREPPLGLDVDQETHPVRERFRAELEDYLQGMRRGGWSVEPAWRGTPFQVAVWRTLFQEVGWGRVVTYGELAALSGFPRSARAVGQAMKLNPWALVVPCHRVVAADGLGGYFGNLDWKRWLLTLEAVRIDVATRPADPNEDQLEPRISRT